MPFNKTFANKIRRQARTKLSEEISLRDPDLRRLVGHANLLDDLLIRTSLAVRGWDGDDDKETIENENGDGRLYKDRFEDGDDDEEEEDSDDDTESDQDSDDSSDDEEDWWDQPLLGSTTTVSEGAGGAACDSSTKLKEPVQMVKIAEEVIAIAEITEGCDITDGCGICEDTETSFAKPTPCAPSRLPTIEESNWEVGDDDMDIDDPPMQGTRLLTPSRTFRGTYGTFDEACGLDPDDFVGPYPTVMDLDMCSCKELELLGLA